MKQRVLCMILTFAFLLTLVPEVSARADTGIWDGSVASGFAGGCGTEGDPYRIETPAQLAYLAQSVNDGMDYFDEYLQLDADLKLNDTTNWELWCTEAAGGTQIAPANTWTPVGYKTYDFTDLILPFKGSFNGNGHTISGVYINTTKGTQGLFGYCIGAKIQNLCVVESNIRSTGQYIGGIVGRVDFNTTVTDCYYSGAVTGGEYVTGGVVGYVDFSTVINCRNAGTINGGIYTGGVVGFENYGVVTNCANSSDIVTGEIVYGGVVGFAHYGAITDCYNTGSVKRGGVVGAADYSTLNRCYNTGSVTGGENGYSVGGVAGHVDRTDVIDCYNTGDVTGIGSFTGGVAGDASCGTVNNCYNTGAVIGNSDTGGIVGSSRSNAITECHNTGTITGINAVAGGVVGCACRDTITKCYNTGMINGSSYCGGVAGNEEGGSIADCHNTGKVSGTYYVGGVVGHADSDGIVTNCYNVAAVMGTDRLGGLVGYANCDAITNCYNTGTIIGNGSYIGGVTGDAASCNVTDCFNAGAFNGADRVGGVAGHADSDGSITNCYNVGTTVKASHRSGGVLADGSDVPVVNCYYLDTCDTSDTTYGTALTDMQMQSAENFTGFDFEHIWTMDGDPNYPYPELSAMPGFQTPQDPEQGFTDVTPNAYYADPVAWAVENNITNGTSATTFSPNTDCTRGQVVTFVWRAVGSPEPTSTGTAFTDVQSSKYYYKAVLWAVENGITTGKNATTFGPDDPCTRGQVVTFLWRAENKPEPSSLETSFTDVKETGYYYKAMCWAVENGITNGLTKTTFGPDKECTRGQIVTFLYRDLAN